MRSTWVGICLLVATTAVGCGEDAETNQGGTGDAGSSSSESTGGGGGGDVVDDTGADSTTAVGNPTDTGDSSADGTSDGSDGSDTGETECQDDDACGAAQHCDGGVCVDDVGPGRACSRAAACSTDWCVAEQCVEPPVSRLATAAFTSSVF